MFETDYPHGDGTWPDTQPVFAEVFGGLPADEVAKIGHENAARLFRHPLPPPGNPHAVGCTTLNGDRAPRSQSPRLMSVFNRNVSYKSGTSAEQLHATCKSIGHRSRRQLEEVCPAYGEGIRMHYTGGRE